MKFDSLIAKELYEDVQDGYCDDEIGSLAENGVVYYLFSEWERRIDQTEHVTILSVILSEDDAGNVFGDVYPNKQSVLLAWDELYQEIEKEVEPLSLGLWDEQT